MALCPEQCPVWLIEHAGSSHGDVLRFDKVENASLGMTSPAQICAVNAIRADADVDKANRVMGRQAEKEVPVIDTQAFAPAGHGFERPLSDQGHRPANSPMTDNSKAYTFIGAVEILVGPMQITRSEEHTS